MRTLKRTMAIATVSIFLLLGSRSFALDANVIQYVQLPKWCAMGDGSVCKTYELPNLKSKRQILILPAGYTIEDYEIFREDFDSLVTQLSDRGDDTFTTTHKQNFLYYAAWLPNGELGSTTANFKAHVSNHPVRDKFLALKQEDVVAAVAKLKNTDGISPWGVIVLFNTTEDGTTANAIPPIYVKGGFGIAKMTRADLDGPYVGIHELAHATLNFLDEYVEYGFENMNINSLDKLTPIALLDDTWGSLGDALQNLLGIYNFKISEVLAANGNDNIDVTRYPSRVATGNYRQNNYEYEGGMLFGRGTWHDRGNNLMNSNHVKRGADDGFDYAHSASQTEVVRNALENPSKAPRPNDRIRNAGPMGFFGITFGSNTQALIFDADKHHAFHPTKSYDIQISWLERTAKVCWKWGVPYPCVELKQRSVQKNVLADKRYLELDNSKLGGLASLLQNILCSTGIASIGTGSGGTVDLCGMSVQEMTSDLLPSTKFLMPYQEVNIPTGQKFTSYFWRFRTQNGSFTSGWTGWNEIRKAF